MRRYLGIPKGATWREWGIWAIGVLLVDLTVLFTVAVIILLASGSCVEIGPAKFGWCNVEGE